MVVAGTLPQQCHKNKVAGFSKLSDYYNCEVVPSCANSNNVVAVKHFVEG